MARHKAPAGSFCAATRGRGGGFVESHKPQTRERGVVAGRSGRGPRAHSSGKRHGSIACACIRACPCRRRRRGGPRNRPRGCDKRRHAPCARCPPRGWRAVALPGRFVQWQRPKPCHRGGTQGLVRLRAGRGFRKKTDGVACVSSFVAAPARQILRAARYVESRCRGRRSLCKGALISPIAMNSRIARRPPAFRFPIPQSRIPNPGSHDQRPARPPPPD